MTTESTTPTRRATPRYGNWVEQRSPGLGSAGLIGTAVFLGGIIFTMVLLLFGGFKGAGFGLVVSGIAFTATGTPVGRRAIRRLGYARQQVAGEHQWRSGVFSRNRSASMRLPGVLGQTVLLEKDDPFGVPFVVIKNPAAGGLYTVVARCVSDGPWLQDADRLNGWVGNYSGVLTTMGQEPALVCAKAITDTAPDPGHRLASMMSAMMPKDRPVPELAARIMRECVADYPSAASENVTYVELTFRGRSLHRRNNETTILSELSRKVSGLLGQLASAGGGAVSMVTRAELPAIVRVAYDPAAQTHLEKAVIARDDYTIEWSDAGPVAYQDLWDRFQHDSGMSVTWEMYDAPRAAVTALAMGALLAPHSDFTRKRVALLYRPHTPDKSMQVSERDANSARFMASQGKKRRTAESELRMQATDRSRQEVADGSVLVRFSILMTATVSGASEADLDQAVATMEAKAGTVPLRVRRCFGSQAAAFATTLPAGFVPWEHTIIPNYVREWM